MKGYEEQVKKDKENVRPLYRSRFWNREERKEEKELKKKGWYKKGGHSSIVEVDYTKDSELAKEYRKAAKEGGIKWKVVEKAGYSLENILVKSNPYKKEQCGDEKCFTCRKPKGGDCRKIGVGYEIICEECEDIVTKYSGESGRNAFSRGREHESKYLSTGGNKQKQTEEVVEGRKEEDKEHPLKKHAKEYHQERKDVDYTMKVTKVFGKNNLKRKVNEHVRIAKSKENGRTMNQKGEYNTPLVPTMTINRSHPD